MLHLRLKIFILINSTSIFMLGFSSSLKLAEIQPLKTVESFHAKILLLKLYLRKNKDNLSVTEGEQHPQFT